jgi:hypothetical protein
LKKKITRREIRAMVEADFDSFYHGNCGPTQEDYDHAEKVLITDGYEIVEEKEEPDEHPWFID